MRILTVNAGSTSLKLATVHDGETIATPRSLDEAAALQPPDAIAHRIVHGGNRTSAVLVDDGIIDELRSLSELAPLHQPPALAALDECRDRWPTIPNVACFDTAFHTTIPTPARTYAIPARYRDVVRQYGFHGLSYAWASVRMRALAPDCDRVLLAHLGGGQSLCGTLHGSSVVTTMGFTPLDGLVMGTRSGTLDPGAVTWLHRNASDVDRMLEHESGLFALCGTSDMRDIHPRVDSGDSDAQLAFDVWTHRVVTLAGGCIAALGGLDALVFTGGIGENDPIARTALANGLAWMGVTLDATANERNATELTGSASSVRAFVVAAQEDLQLATETEACLRDRPLQIRDHSATGDDVNRDANQV